MRPALSRLTQLALLLHMTVPGQLLQGQSDRKGEVKVEHSAKRVTNYSGEVRARGKNGLAFSVPAGVPVEVMVSGSNSALYECSLKTEPVPVPEAEALRSWLAQLKTYLPLVASAIFPALVETLDSLVIALPRDVEELRTALGALDDITVGDSGMTATQDGLLLGLDTLSRVPLGASLAGTAEQIRRSLGDQTALVAEYRPSIPGSLETMTFPAAVIRASAALRKALAETRAFLVKDSAAVKEAGHKIAQNRDSITEATKIASDANKSPRERAAAKVVLKRATDAIKDLEPKLVARTERMALREDVIAIGEAALADAPKHLEAAYALEGFSRIVLGAKDTFACETVSVVHDTGSAVTLKITPRGRSEIARLTTVGKEVSVEFSLMPDWKIRPGVGLALLVAPKAVYPTFTTIKNGEGDDQSVKVTAKGEQDRRFDYGLTLGLTYRRWDHRDTGGPTIWLPELTINPADDIRSVGVGAGISWSVVKLGVGLLWAKHDEPDASTPEGAVLPNAEAFKTVSRLGPPHLYVSFSLIGLPPFLTSKD